MFRVGMIGTGDIATTHARNLARIEGVSVTGAFDAMPERTAAFAETFGAQVHPDLATLLSSSDAVYICTPPQYHRDAAILSAAAGVHVFCEKPLSASVQDAEAIREAVSASGISFMVGFVFRFSALFQRFHDLVRSGDLGDVLSFWGTRVMWLPHLPPNWRTDPRFIVGMTIESLSHDFDFMRWVAGNAVSAMGRVSTSRPDLDGYDNLTSAILKLKAGGMASFHTSWAGHVPVSQYGVIGSRGSAVIDRGVIRWRLETEEAERIIECNRPEDGASGHQRETEHFIDCLRTGRPPSVGVDDGVATVRISHAVLRSSAEGREVAVG